MSQPHHLCPPSLLRPPYSKLPWSFTWSINSCNYLSLTPPFTAVHSANSNEDFFLKKCKSYHLTTTSFHPTPLQTYIHTLFITLQWFPFAHRIWTKLLTMSFHGLHDLAPAYLFFLILPPFLYHVLAPMDSVGHLNKPAVFLSQGL